MTERSEKLASLLDQIDALEPNTDRIDTLAMLFVMQCAHCRLSPAMTFEVLGRAARALGHAALERQFKRQAENERRRN